MVVQLAIVILTLSVFYLLHTFPSRTLTKLRTKSRSSAQANRHFVAGAHLLSRARSTRNRTASLSLANDAVSEADNALIIDPKDAAAHILKALSLDLLGRRPAALKSLDVALSQRGLSDGERADALVKRAELHMAVNKRRRVDAAIEDVEEAVRLGAGNSRAYCLLGECYEFKGMKEIAREAFENAIRVEPGSVPARQGLDRVGAVRN